MSSEHLTIDLIVDDEQARAKVTQFLQATGATAKLVKQPIDGWSDGVANFGRQLQNLVVGGGALAVAHRMAREMREAYQTVTTGQAAASDLQGRMSAAVKRNIVNALPIPIPGGTRQKTEAEVRAEALRVVGAGGGGDIIDTVNWIGAFEGAAAGIQQGPGDAMKAELQRLFNRTRLPPEDQKQYAVAMAMAMQTAQRRGWSPKATMGYVEFARNLSLVGGMKEFAETFVPYWRGVEQAGGTSRDALLLSSLTSHAAGDEGGHVAITMASGLYRGLLEGKWVKGGRGYARDPATGNLPPIDQMLYEAQDHMEDIYNRQGMRGLIRAIPKEFKGARGGAATMAFVAIFLSRLRKQADVLANELREAGQEVTEADVSKVKPLEALWSDFLQRSANMTPESLEAFYALTEGKADPGAQANIVAAQTTAVTQTRLLGQSETDSGKARFRKARSDAFGTSQVTGRMSKTSISAVAELLTAAGVAPATAHAVAMRLASGYAKMGTGGRAALGQAFGGGIFSGKSVIQGLVAGEDASALDAAMFQQLAAAAEGPAPSDASQGAGGPLGPYASQIAAQRAAEMRRRPSGMSRFAEFGDWLMARGGASGGEIDPSAASEMPGGKRLDQRAIDAWARGGGAGAVGLAVTGIVDALNAASRMLQRNANGDVGVRDPN